MGREAYSLDIVGRPDFKISITNRTKFNDINKKLDGIFHLAAVTSPPQFETDPDKGLKVNVNGTYNVLDFARKHGVNKVVLASSSAIYGIYSKFSSLFILSIGGLGTFPVGSDELSISCKIEISSSLSSGSFEASLGVLFPNAGILSSIHFM